MPPKKDNEGEDVKPSPATKAFLKRVKKDKELLAILDAMDDP